MLFASKNDSPPYSLTNKVSATGGSATATLDQ